MGNFHSSIRWVTTFLSDSKRVVSLMLIVMFLGALLVVMLVDEKSKSKEVSGRDRYAKYIQERDDREATAAKEQKLQQKEAIIMQRKAEAENLLLETDKAMDAIAKFEF